MDSDDFDPKVAEEIRKLGRPIDRTPPAIIDLSNDMRDVKDRLSRIESMLEKLIESDRST